MSTVEQVTQLLAGTRNEFCDACVANKVGRSRRQVSGAAQMLGKARLFNRDYRRCQCCGALGWITQRPHHEVKDEK